MKQKQIEENFMNRIKLDHEEIIVKMIAGAKTIPVLDLLEEYRHKRFPYSLLKYLLTNTAEEVQSFLSEYLGNRGIQFDLLKNHKSQDILEGLLKNICCNSDILQEYSNHHSEDIRALVAIHKNTPDCAWEDLLCDDSLMVQVAALKKPIREKQYNILLQKLEEFKKIYIFDKNGKALDLLSALAQNTSFLSQDIYYELSALKDKRINKILLNNNKIELELRESIFPDGDRNLNTPIFKQYMESLEDL